jgi:hypothetical protein
MCGKTNYTPVRVFRTNYRMELPGGGLKSAG